jgi:hypothetical protein
VVSAVAFNNLATTPRAAARQEPVENAREIGLTYDDAPAHQTKDKHMNTNCDKCGEANPADTHTCGAWQEEVLKLAAEFDKRFTSMNGVDVPERVSVPRDEWRALHTAIKQDRALDKMAENARELGLDYEPVKEPSGFFRHEDVCGDEVGPPTPYYLTQPAAAQPAPVQPVASLLAAIQAEPVTLIHKWRVLELVKEYAAQPAQQETVGPLKEADVLIMAEAHGIDANTKGLYGFYIDCISTNPPAAPVQPVGVFVEDDDIGHVRLNPHQQLKLKDGDPVYATPPTPTGNAPCARHCEATAFQITIRGLKGEIERMKAAQQEVTVPDDMSHAGQIKIKIAPDGDLHITTTGKDSWTGKDCTVAIELTASGGREGAKWYKIFRDVLLAAAPEAPAQQEPVGWTELDLILLDRMIYEQRCAANSWDDESNRELADKYKGFHIARVELLKKVKTTPPTPAQQEVTVPDLTHDAWDEWQDKHSLILEREALDDLRSMLAAAQPAQPAVPLTDEQIESLLPDDDTPMSLGEAFVKFARLVEAHHGITKGQP